MVHGFAGAGKDTVVDYIVKNTKYKRYAFADPVREAAKVIFNIPEMYHNYLTSPDLKNLTIPTYKLSAREMCQVIGNEMRELFYPSIWCENLEKRATANKDKYIIISDNRYPNEHEYFDDKYKTISIKVCRNGKDGNVGIANHPSETHVNSIPFDFIIDNDSTFEKLYEQIDTLIDKGKI